MKTSPKGIELIKLAEGFVNHVYRDAAGLDTIGYGHLVRPNESYENLVLTMLEATELLQHDVAAAESAVNHLVAVPLNQNQFDALVSFTFNLGSQALKSSTLLRRLNARDYSIQNEFKKWINVRDSITKQLVPNTGLMKRRQYEIDLWSEPCA